MGSKIMQVDEEMVRKIAHLARLHLEEEFIPMYSSKLTNIFNLVETISDLDVSNCTPMAHPLEVSQPLREDTITETDQREKLLQNSKHKKAGLILVPKVIE